jgi:hypothetical protein
MCLIGGCPEVSMPEFYRVSSGAGFIACAGIAYGKNSILIRSSLKPETVVEFTADEWHALVAAIKDGEFDNPSTAI